MPGYGSDFTDASGSSAGGGAAATGDTSQSGGALSAIIKTNVELGQKLSLINDDLRAILICLCDAYQLGSTAEDYLEAARGERQDQ